MVAATPADEISAEPQQAQLHTNGCGDFTLMALENWLDLRGYPEFDTFSMHLDSIFCLSAHYGGVVEEVLDEPMRIYHIEHGAGSGWTPEGQAKLFARIAERGLSMIENPEVIGWAKQMQKLRRPMIFNLENWGLADFQLDGNQSHKRVCEIGVGCKDNEDGSGRIACRICVEHFGRGAVEEYLAALQPQSPVAQLSHHRPGMGYEQQLSLILAP